MKRRSVASAFGRGALAATAALLLLASCAGTRHRAPTLAEVKAMPVKQTSTYVADIGRALAKPVAQRIAAMPKLVLDYYRSADGVPSYAAYAPSGAELALFAEYYATLPPRFKAVLEAKLLGVYFIDNFLGGGMTDFAFGPDGAQYYVLTLNPRVLKEGLAEWLSYRDSSPYEAAGEGAELRVSCAGGEGYKGLIHTLTHEAAHIYDFSVRVTPFVEPLLATSSDKSEDKDFTRGFWEGYSKQAAAYSIPNRERFSFYGLGEKLPLPVAAEQYEALARTPFASMYGAASWAEDFAEAAAWTWLRDELGIAYSVVVRIPGKRELVFEPGKAKTSMAREDAIRAVLD
jgi:hypothetical protein